MHNNHLQKLAAILGCLSSLISVSAQKIITLDLQNPTAPATIEMTEDGCWTETFNKAEEYKWIEFGLFRFSHMYNSYDDADVPSEMTYWDGFTVCDNGDNADYGEGMSGNWLKHQWGNMACGGIMTDETGMPVYDEKTHAGVPEWGLPYLVAYWGFQYGETCLQVQFTDDKPHRPVGVYINNHPWPYYGNINGDSFASGLTNEGDFFKVIAHGMTETGEEAIAELKLAEFKDGELHQSDQWEWMDLSSMGEVTSLYFTLEASDTDILYGINTAAYFCMDKLQVMEYGVSTAPQRPANLKAEATETTLTVSWDASEGATSYTVAIDGQAAGTTADCTWTFDNLQPLSEHTITIVATNGEQNSDFATLQASTIDISAPSVPTIVSANPHIYSIDLEWLAAEDNVAVDVYTIYLDDEPVRRIADTRFTLTGLDPATTYDIAIDARDASGNYSERATVEVTTLPTESTGINPLPTPSASPSTKAYDLNGRQLPFGKPGLAGGNRLVGKKGILIVNGKKVTGKQ